MTKDFGTSRTDIRLRVSDDCITWRNICQLYAAASAGYTSMYEDTNGSLFIAFEPAVDIVMWNFSQFKDDLIK